jgi:membrane-bound lytic murein transglycosylase A
LLASCALRPPPAPSPAPPGRPPGLPPAGPVADTAPLGPTMRARAQPLGAGALGRAARFSRTTTRREAWNAWIKSCERPGPTFARLCSEVRRLSPGQRAEQRRWMRARLQPYRVEPAAGAPAGEGLLTGYFEPLYEASAQRAPGLCGAAAPPAGRPGQRKPWYTRQQIDTLPAARPRCAARRSPGWPTRWTRWCCRSRARAGCASPSPTAASSRCAWPLPATNDQPYRSVGRWLIDQGELRATAPPGRHPQPGASGQPGALQRDAVEQPAGGVLPEEPLPDDAQFGPRGAQGVPLTPGRSIAVDPHSIPYGTPVWLASTEPSASRCAAW